MPSDKEFSDMWQRLLLLEDIRLLEQELTGLADALRSSQSAHLAAALDGLRLSTIEQFGLSDAQKKSEILALTVRVLAELKQMSPIILEVAVEPSRSFAKMVGGRLKQRLGEHTVVDFKLNSSLLGGVRITWNGKYLDSSLKTMIDALESSAAHGNI